ncbi:DUF418 domain-containing protein [Salininema proteolyticum]|uniref:DUF418 domain-containing protein n=1 Tax=Salininema proteolyticum TaxID=1607685 RepID=A0ABV8TUD6_9ACTN
MANTLDHPARIAALDLLRGIAIVGTLASNIWVFMNPLGAWGLFTAADSMEFAERALWALANGKFLSLLAILFGVGIEIQYQSSKRRMQSWYTRYLWRTAVLFMEGLIHYLLIFEWDVLMGYALVSVHVAYLVTLSTKAIRRWFTGFAAVSTAIVAFVTVGSLRGDGGLAVTGADTGTFMHGTWWDQVVDRVQYFALFRMETIVLIPFASAMFLGGILLMRSGFFTATDKAAVRRRWIWTEVCLPIGAAITFRNLFAGTEFALIDRYIAAPLIAVGIAALTVNLVQRGKAGRGIVGRGMSNVGRTALSSYIFQNVVASALCYGWGLGLAVRWNGAMPWSAVLLWALISVLFMVLSTLWLKRFRQGPAEFAMRRIAQAPFRHRRPAEAGR